MFYVLCFMFYVVVVVEYNVYEPVCMLVVVLDGVAGVSCSCHGSSILLVFGLVWSSKPSSSSSSESCVSHVESRESNPSEKIELLHTCIRISDTCVSGYIHHRFDHISQKWRSKSQAASATSIKQQRNKQTKTHDTTRLARPTTQPNNQIIT